MCLQSVYVYIYTHTQTSVSVLQIWYSSVCVVVVELITWSDSLRHWTAVRQAPLSMGSPGKNAGVGRRSLLRGIFSAQGWNLSLLQWQADPLLLIHQGSPSIICRGLFFLFSHSDQLMGS